MAALLTALQMPSVYLTPPQNGWYPTPSLSERSTPVASQVSLGSVADSVMESSTLDMESLTVNTEPSSLDLAFQGSSNVLQPSTPQQLTALSVLSSTLVLPNPPVSDESSPQARPDPLDLCATSALRESTSPLVSPTPSPTSTPSTSLRSLKETLQEVSCLPDSRPLKRKRKAAASAPGGNPGGSPDAAPPGPSNSATCARRSRKPSKKHFNADLRKSHKPNKSGRGKGGAVRDVLPEIDENEEGGVEKDAEEQPSLPKKMKRTFLKLGDKALPYQIAINVNAVVEHIALHSVLVTRRDGDGWKHLISTIVDLLHRRILTPFALDTRSLASCLEQVVRMEDTRRIASIAEAVSLFQLAALYSS